MKRPKTTHNENLARLARIEGQIRGIRRMIKNEIYCIDILTQLQAAHCALQAVARKIFRKHVENCVASAIRSRSAKEIERKITEVMEILRRAEF
ncbi:MAG: metal-sensitive transcriptional regulator [Kiritimatiellia bacterium]|nr:metal-sensitive transcriptional regulator [Kiritimatiellia bacterium]